MAHGKKFMLCFSANGWEMMSFVLQGLCAQSRNLTLVSPSQCSDIRNEYENASMGMHVCCFFLFNKGLANDSLVMTYQVEAIPLTSC